MKKYIAALLLLAVCLLAVSCGGNPAEGTSSPSSTAATAEKPYIFASGTVQIAMNAKADTVIPKLPEPIKYFEAPSCAFNGIDKTYTYQGFQLVTYPYKDADYVSSILLIDDTVKTPEGLSIGAPAAQVTQLYGEAAPQDGAYKYAKGDSTLTIVIKDDAVSSIEYTALPPEDALVAA